MMLKIFNESLLNSSRLRPQVGRPRECGVAVGHGTQLVLRLLAGVHGWGPWYDGVHGVMGSMV